MAQGLAMMYDIYIKRNQSAMTDFIFDPTFDYYELWEACMSDPTLEAVMDDTEDYEEFIETLRKGLWTPQ